LLDRLTDSTETVLGQAQAKLYEAKTKLLKDLSFYSIAFLATIFLLVGASKYLEDFYQTFPGGGLIIVAGGLYLIALIYKAFSR